MRAEYQNDTLTLHLFEHNGKKMPISCPHCGHTRIRDSVDYELKWSAGYCRNCHHMFAYDWRGNSYKGPDFVIYP